MLANFCQTFFIHKDFVQGADTVFITSVDLKFSTVPTSGSSGASGLEDPTVAVSVCESDSSTGEYVPNLDKQLYGAERSKSSSIISTSTWTNFKFDSPIPVKPDVVYAIVISFDGDSSFTLYTSSTATTGTTPSNYQDGKMFIMSEGSLKPLNDQDLLFKVNIAQFDTGQNGAELEVLNDRIELLTINNITTTQTGLPFFGDEFVLDSNNSPLTGNVNINSNTNLLQGTSTTYSLDFVPGDYAVLCDTNNILTAGSLDVIAVNNVISNTQLYLVHEPSFDASTGRVFRVCQGQMFSYTPSSNTLVLWNSTASNSTIRFTTDSFLFGVDSRTTCSIANVFNYSVNKFNADLNIEIPNQTNASIRIALSNTAYNWQESNFVKSISGSNNEFSIYDGIIASRSNEIVNTGNLYDPGSSANTTFRYKSMVMRVQMNTQNQYTSPYFKTDLANFILWNNYINNDITGETGRYGNSASKWISKTITLAEGLDAEDIRVYVTAIQPPDTSIQPFVKIANKVDTGNFDDHNWTQLVLKNIVALGQVTADVSPTGVPEDYVELEYGFSTQLDDHGDILTKQNGEQVFATVTAGQTNVTLTSSNTLPTVLAGNDVIGIYNPAFPNVHFISVISAVVNTTVITLNQPMPTSTAIQGSGNFVYKVQTPYALSAFNNILNNNVVRYFSASNNGIFDTYKSFSVKVCLLSSNTTHMPRLDDIRCVSCSS